MTVERGSASKIRYGGDYNPEQWPHDVWDLDDKAFTKAHIETLTIGVFDWAQLQPDEGHYDLGLLDEIVGHLTATGRQFVMGTSTGALPPWLAHQHPEVNRTDFEGRRHVYGQRHNACPARRSSVGCPQRWLTGSRSALPVTPVWLPGTSAMSTAGRATAVSVPRVFDPGCGSATAPCSG